MSDVRDFKATAAPNSGRIVDKDRRVIAPGRSTLKPPASPTLTRTTTARLGAACRQPASPPKASTRPQ